MNMPFKDPGGRKLLDEIQILTIVLSTAIILIVQIVSMFIISYSMGSTMKQDAERVANELVSFLVEPLYNIDDQQANRIAESLLLSGRLSGITLVSTASGTLISEMRSEDSRYIEPITREIRRDNLILGTVVLHFSDKEITATKNQFIFIGILIMAAVIAVNLIVNRLFLQKRMLGSLQAILEGIASIRSGDYTSRIKGSEYTDVNMLVTLINEMSASILAKNSQLLEANTLLEGRVAERTTELSKSLAELRQAQDRLVESGKLSALGLLSAGMAHELNTPLGAILSSNRNVIDFFDSKMQGFRDFFLSLSDREYALYTNALAQGGALSRSLDVPEVDRSRQKEIRAILEERGVQDSRAVTDYLVDLGLDPDDSVLGPLLVENRAVEILTAVSDLLITRRMAEIVDIAGKKAATVVSALRFYLSTDHEDMQATVDIEQDIDKILTLMHNMLKHGVTIKREYSGVRTKGSSDKLGQVWMNILRNAAQAMDFKGEIIIRTQTQDALTIVSFIDSGPGIPDDILPRVFDPFFTTKKQGEGMGLGLDICRRIIESHKGTIELETRPGRTEFRIILPAI
ncbi:MAG: hypothetical protein JW875_08045 [Spirochaetales bacterium]|nr:hypothetical protein [Spirochaetales bacterium]